MDDEAILNLYRLRQAAALTETEAKYGRLCFCVADRILNSREEIRAALLLCRGPHSEQPRRLGGMCQRHLAARLERHPAGEAEAVSRLALPCDEKSCDLPSA